MQFLRTLLNSMALCGTIYGHVIMTYPVPYGQDTLNNSPLAADGSDFPCKLRTGVYRVSETNTASVGETVSLAFEGGAVHGGGSCQISLTRDLTPDKASEWMVIKSIEGGCPVTASENLPLDPKLVVPSDLHFEIPEGIEPGSYTLAWTWFNRIGNREMFMNCAPLTILPKDTAGIPTSNKCQFCGTTDVSHKFPPMFIANINGCVTSEMEDIRFPFPGDIVEYKGDPANLAPAGKPACT